MQNFIFGSTLWRTIRAFGTNPLVRVSDRIEAILVVSAVAISLLAVPVAGAIGTAVYDARSRTYTEELQSRRPQSAIVSATRRNVTVSRPYVNTTIIEVRWRSGGVQHTDIFSANGPFAVGDQIDIWVDDQGEFVRPRPFQAAAVDAACVAVLLCLILVGATTALFALVRWRLDRRRDAEWERAIGDLVYRRPAD